MDKKNKFSILPIFFTVFIDLLGLGIIIPILPAIISDPINGILPFSTSNATRALIYGFLIASYPIAQFFGAPILGALSDRYGRKKLLTLSLIGTFLGYILFGIGVYNKTLWLLFIGRIIDGFTGGNISIAQSVISDVSDEKSRARNFGLIGMAFGFGFVIGPYVGGFLSDPNKISWFNYTTPFWFSAILSLINLFLVYFLLKETLKEAKKTKISALTGFKNINKAMKMKNMRMIFIVVFFLTFGFNFFTQFFQFFLYNKFHFTASKIGDLFAYMGIWIALSQGAVQRPLSKKWTPKTILSISSLLLALTFPLLLIPKEAIYLYLIVPFIAIFQGLTQPNSIALVSNSADNASQGEILGINASIQSAAQAIPPIIAGFITAINIDLPIVGAAVSTFIAWCIFVTYFKKRRSQVSKI